MFHGGLRYVPEIVDSIVFGLFKAIDRLNLRWPPAPRYWNKIIGEIKRLYPHASKLMNIVDVGIKRLSGFDYPFFFCWPVDVVGIKGVLDEVDILLKGKLFSIDDPKDRELLKKEAERTLFFS